VATAVQREFGGTERFVLQRRLGAGHFGVVYQAYDRQRNRMVALKTLKQMDAKALYRFKQEFRTLADVSHANLVSLYELLNEGDEWFFTMELVQGSDLLEYIVNGPRSSWVPASLEMESTRTALPDFAGWLTLDTKASTFAADQAYEPRAEHASVETPLPKSRITLTPEYLQRLRSAFAQLASGICALHDAGIQHRDIKPTNVLVTQQGRVLLADFGLATAVQTGMQIGDSMQSVHAAGTPAYMAPEQTRGEVSEAADWYSVGVMLYEALTGSLPFVGSIADMFIAKQRQDGPPPSLLSPDVSPNVSPNVSPGVPQDLDELCAGLLRLSPGARSGRREILQVLREAGPSIPEAEPAATPRAAPLIGREKHLAILREAFLATQNHRTATVCVHGPSGMGKTILVRGFLRALRERVPDVVVLTGRCYERESVPYKAFDSLVDSLSRYLKRLRPLEAERLMPRDVLALARLFPVLQEVPAVAQARRRVLDILDSQELRRRAFGALRELLARLSDVAPLVLFIDDLHWGDLDSGALLGELLSPPEPPNLLLVVCYRSEEAERSPLLRLFLARLEKERLEEVRQEKAAADPAIIFETLNVEQLVPEEAEELALVLLGPERAEAPESAKAIARESGGSPFFLNELVRYALSGEALSGEGVTGEITVERVIQARVKQLPEPDRRLLEFVAVASKPIRLEAVWNAAGLDVAQGDAQGAVSTLRGARLVRTREIADGEEIESSHDRVRETIVGHLSKEALRECHRNLAMALVALPDSDPETLAQHYYGAGELSSAAEYALRAADRAAEALAFDRAAGLYRMALDLRPAAGPQDPGLYVKLAQALVNAGRGFQAAQNFLAAADLSTALDAVELRRRAAEQFLCSGHTDQGLATLSKVLNSVGMRLPETPGGAILSLVWYRALLKLRGLNFRERDASQIPPEQLNRIDCCWSVSAGLGVMDPLRAAGFQARQVLLALRAGEPYRIARALAQEISYSALPGEPARPAAEKLAQKTLALAEKVGNPHAIALATVNAGIAARLQGRYKVALELVERAEKIFREKCTGVQWELASCAVFTVEILSWTGEIRKLGQLLPAYLKEAQERGDRYAIGTLLHQTATLAADDPAQARENLRRGMEGWTHEGFRVQNSFALIALTETDLYCGDAQAALDRVEQAWPSLKKSLLLHMQAQRIASPQLRARAALAMGAAGHDDRYLQEVEREARGIERERVLWGTGLALLLRAGVAATRGKRQDALALASSAQAACQAADMLLYAAAAQRRRGELLGGAEGQALVTAADSIMAAQDVKNPSRFTAMLAPGRWSGS
jgi:serine/threonine protein kinase/predicted ATPase